MAGVGKEGAGVGKHTVKCADKAFLRHCFHHIENSALVVAEPPCGTADDIGEAVAGGVESIIHGRVQGVDHRFGHTVSGVDGIQHTGNISHRGKIAGAVNAAVLAKLLENFGVEVAEGGEVQLHSDVVFFIKAAQFYKHVAGKLVILFVGNGVAAQSLFKYTGCINCCTNRVGEYAGADIGETAAEGAEICQSFFQGSVQRLQIDDGKAAGGRETGDVFRIADLTQGEQHIGAEGGGHGDFKAGFLDQLVILQGVGRVVCGGDIADIGHEHQLFRGELSLFYEGKGLVPDFGSSVGIEGLFNAEEHPQPHVAPVIERVAGSGGKHLGKLIELFFPACAAGHVIFVYAIGAHETPFVVVAAQPDFTDIVEGFVFVDHLRGEMAVIVDDREVAGNGIVKAACSSRGEKIVVRHIFLFGPGHSESLLDMKIQFCKRLQYIDIVTQMNGFVKGYISNKRSKNRKRRTLLSVPGCAIMDSEVWKRRKRE